MNMDPHPLSGGPPASTRPATGLRSTPVLATVFVAIAMTLSITAPPLGAATVSRTLTLTEADNHHTVAVSPGTRITVTLHNTYWSLTPLASSTILSQVGASTVAATKPGTGGCVPGQGCGTVTDHFVARHAGFVRLRAHRTTCGEAMRCAPAQGVWTVVVHVR